MHALRIDPIAFSLGQIDVHWYGIILGLGALAGLLLAVQEGKRFGFPPDFFMDLLLFGVPSAIIVARTYYVAFMWDEYRHNFADVFKIWNGGIAIYGALIGAFLCGLIYVRVKGYSFWRVVDICAPSLIAGQLIGRWGNFVNQEAYGGPVSEAFLRDTLHIPGWIVNQMYVQEEGIFHHPTFLYESLWNLVGLILLFILRRQRFTSAGEVVLSYLIWYSIGRFFIEALRTDSLAFQGPDWLASFINAMWSPMKAFGFEQGALSAEYGNVRISMVVAVVLVVLSIVLWIYRRLSGAASERYSDPIISFKTGLPAGVSEASGKDAVSAADPASADAAAADPAPSAKENGHDNEDKHNTV